MAGCAEGTCDPSIGEVEIEVGRRLLTDTGSCQCVPGRVARNGGCVAADSMQTMSFYMYRAQNDEDYPLDSDNTASLEAVMWYLHNEVVVMSCPRHYDITKIVRYNVTMRNPDRAENSHSQYGPFVAIDSGKCTVPGCDQIIENHGYYVGCQIEYGKNYGAKVYWYSLFGACPLQPYSNKTDECKQEFPGGKCAEGQQPDGQNCTWSYEKAGEIRIDELEGIDDYKQFCDDGKKEYVLSEDKGEGCSFWDGKMDADKNADRVAAAQKLFQKVSKAPLLTPTPLCDV